MGKARQNLKRRIYSATVGMPPAPNDVDAKDKRNRLIERRSNMKAGVPVHTIKSATTEHVHDANCHHDD